MKTKSNLFKSIHILLAATFSILILSSCNTYKQLPYLKNGKDIPSDTLSKATEAHEASIMPNDILSITVNSTIPGAASDFNLPMIPGNVKDPIQNTVSIASATSGSLQNYIVDKNGEIDFPILGTLKLSGMKVGEAQDYLISLIYPRYIAERPVVNIRFVNFGVSVLGEVAKPGIYNSANGQMTLLDALAAAGDMTIYGKRNNVLLVRTLESGEIVTHRIDMQDKNLIRNKDLFYLQQNDKLYVETNKAKGNSSQFGALESIGLSALSIVISIVTLLTR